MHLPLADVQRLLDLAHGATAPSPSDKDMFARVESLMADQQLEERIRFALTRDLYSPDQLEVSGIEKVATRKNHDKNDTEIYIVRAFNPRTDNSHWYRINLKTNYIVDIKDPHAQ